MSFNDQPTVGEPSPETPTLFKRARLYAFYLLALVTLAMAAAFTAELLTLSLTGWGSAGVLLAEHRLHVMTIAALIWITVLGVAAQLYRPRRRAALLQASFGVVTLVLLGTVLGGGPLQEVLPFFILIGLMTLLHPEGLNVLASGDDYSPVLLALVGVAAIPLLAFAANQVLLQGSGDSHALLGHYAEMAVMSIALLMMGLIASAGATGHRYVAWETAGLAVYVGSLSIAFPAQASAVGLIWGSLLIVWGVSFVAVSELRTAGRTTLGRERQLDVDRTLRV
ncbi:hypothetical protein ACFQJC_12700 [Haloferax namakaokahaiae]|uniref:Uncharacterized protein n=1 Tax=Haloferax namakaokahaiae TaxID=1748331 RepID=A0ABD5ZH18_9EURY